MNLRAKSEHPIQMNLCVRMSKCLLVPFKQVLTVKRRRRGWSSGSRYHKRNREQNRDATERKLHLENE